METKRRNFEKSITKRHQANNHCPCGKSNKDGKFANEIGFEGQSIGSCHSCGKDFWPDSRTLVDHDKVKAIASVPKEPTCMILQQDLIRVFDDNLQSNYAQYLVKQWSEKAAIEMVENHFLGLYDGQPIFWYIDMNKVIRGGFILKFDTDGHRAKTGPYQTRWWHKEKRLACTFNRCFYGEHKIPNSNKPIAVCEAESTAVEASKLQHGFTWVASGGKGVLKNLAHRLHGMDVTLFPDFDAFDLWSEIGRSNGFRVSNQVLEWEQKGLIGKTGDIRDYYRAIQPGKIDAEWNDFVDENPKKNLTKN